MSVALFIREDLVAEKLSEINAFIPRLQSIHDALDTLGVSEISMDTIEELINSNGTIRSIKQLIFGGDTATVGAVKVSIDVLEIDMSVAQPLSDQIKSFIKSYHSNAYKRVTFSNYDIVEGEVVLADNVEDDLNDHYTVRGSELAAEIIEDVDALMVDLNAIYAKIKAGAGISSTIHHALRNPERLIDWDGSQFVTNKYEIARHVNPELIDE